MDPSTAPLMIAAVDGTVLVRSFLIALVLVLPYGLYKWRQVRRLRAERAAAEAPPEPAAAAPSRPRLEEVIAGIEELSGTVARTGTATLTIPPEVTVGGRDAPAELVDTLVRDALRRSGLAATAEVDTPGGRVIECRAAGG